MPRVLGVDIPGRKRLPFALRYIYGIGPTLANEVIVKAGLDPEKKADDLTADEIAGLGAMLQSDYRIEGDLRREISSNIRRLISIGSYRSPDVAPTTMSISKPLGAAEMSIHPDPTAIDRSFRTRRPPTIR